MKSKGEDVMLVMLGILADARAAYPRALGLERDKTRLTLCFQQRGLPLFTLDLPALDERLLSCLENGTLAGPGFLMKRKSQHDSRPRFLWDLWSRVVDSSCMLKSEADPNAILFLRQIFCLGKKLALPCTPDRVQNAVKDYHDIEAKIVPPALSWHLDHLGTDRCAFERSFHQAELPLFPSSDGHKGDSAYRDFLRRLDSVSSIVVSELGYFSPLYEGGSRVDRFKHGPGAVADANSQVFKFDFPHWPAKLDSVFDFAWCGSSALDDLEHPDPSEPPSKLIAVPKTAKGPRLIASEPIAHQWCQQWIKNELVERMRTSLIGRFVNTLDQTLSQERVLEASKSRSLSTLDLSSASDRVSCRHVEALLGANRSLLEACHAVRTRWLVDSLSTKRTFVKLKKFAAMGSALTFPIQSIFFACVALAACGAHDRRSIMALTGKVRVFGDDIIVPTEGYATTVASLTQLGLKVNQAKSFSLGFFRESCGVDAWKGVDITPIKPKALWCNGPETYQAVVDSSNNLHKAGFWNAAAALASIARHKRFTPVVVPMSSGLPGLESFVSGGRPSVIRWNGDLHRYEGRYVSLKVKQKRKNQDKASVLLQFYTAEWSAERPRILGLTQKASANLAYVWREVA